MKHCLCVHQQVGAHFLNVHKQIRTTSVTWYIKQWHIAGVRGI